jgi:hypothetical protein
MASLQSMGESMAEGPTWTTPPEALALGFEQEVSTCGFFVVSCHFAVDDKQLVRAQRYLELLVSRGHATERPSKTPQHSDAAQLRR